jgi:hypothetical protein
MTTMTLSRLGPTGQNGQYQEKGGEADDNLDHAGYDNIYPAAVEACKGSHDHAYGDIDEYSDESDEYGYPCSMNHAGRQVAALLIGAHDVLRSGTDDNGIQIVLGRAV